MILFPDGGKPRSPTPSAIPGNIFMLTLTREIPNIHSLLIMKDDRLVLEEYFHGYSRDRLHRVHSVTKSFTSALLGIAIGKGFIPDENEPVWKYFAERDSTRWVKKKYDCRKLPAIRTQTI
jgi:CubicO group peptidase (beta-lactamase class C family)